jgi:hypothetical protein
MLPRLLRLHPSTYQRLIRLSKEAERDGAYRVAKRLRAVVLNSEGHTSGQLTNRRIIRDSSLARQGRGGCHLALALAFCKLRINASFGSLRDSGRYSEGIFTFYSPSFSLVLAELPVFLKIAERSVGAWHECDRLLLRPHPPPGFYFRKFALTRTRNLGATWAQNSGVNP